MFVYYENTSRRDISGAAVAQISAIAGDAIVEEVLGHRSYCGLRFVCLVVVLWHLCCFPCHGGNGNPARNNIMSFVVNQCGHGPR